MDYTILYWILAGIGLVGLTVLGTWILKKRNINTEDLLNGIDVGRSIIAFASKLLKTMNIDETKFDVDFFSDLIFDALNYVESFGDEISKEQKTAEIIDYINDIAESFDEHLNDNDIEILETVVILCLNMVESIQKNK